MRRVLNALLQFIEQDTSESVIIAATNKPTLLDRALFRRFDDVLYYDMPDPEDRRRLVANVLGYFKAKSLDWPSILKVSESLSHAEVDRACRDAIKDAVLNDRKTVGTSALVKYLEERRLTHDRQ